MADFYTDSFFAGDTVLSVSNTSQAIVSSDSVIQTQTIKPVVVRKKYSPSQYKPDAVTQTVIDSTWFDAAIPGYVSNHPWFKTQSFIYFQESFSSEIQEKIIVEKSFDNPGLKYEQHISTSFKGNKILSIDNSYTEGHNFSGNDWITGVILFSVFVLAWLRLFYGRTMVNFIYSAFDSRNLNRLFEDNNPVTGRVGFILNLNFILMFSLFIFLAFKHYYLKLFSLPSLPTYLIFCGFFTLLFLSRGIFMGVLQWILKNKTFSEYLFITMNINKFYGILILPFLICIPYINIKFIDYLIITGAAIYILFYLLQIFRGILLTFKIKLSIFYLILYICTLEIIPLLLLYKAVNLLFS